MKLTHYRNSQNWIGQPGCDIEQAQYVPPEPRLVAGCMDNWEKYYHSNAPDLLVQLAIIHAQFEIVHPFLDGNGRLGRIIIPLFLFEKKLLSKPVFYLSGYLEQNREEYIGRLRAIGTEPDGWERWIQFFLLAIEAQAETNSAAACSMTELYNRLKKQVIDLTHSQFAVPLLDALFEHPVFPTSQLFERPGFASKQVILTLLAKLRGAGILTLLRESSGRRPQLLAFPELINLCEGRQVFEPIDRASAD